MLFLAFTLLTMIALIATEWTKRISFKSLAGLFLFGVLISTPFVLIEHMELELKYYVVILAFIAIELGILYCEEHISFFHNLIHHNVKALRIISFLIIGLGFTYSELSATILHSHMETAELLTVLPFKAMFALLMHTVLTSASTLVHVGNMFAETIFETIFKFVSYYLRITVISLSHFLYMYSAEHHLGNLMTVMLVGSMLFFFYIKQRLDKEALLD
jgi:hypothetical protein